MAYAGRQPTTGFRSTPTKDSFNGDNSTVAFTLSIPTRTNDVEVFVENVQQEPVTAYSISGNTLTFTSAPPTGTGNIYVIHRAELVSNGVHTPGANLEGGVTTLDSLTVTGATDIDTSLNVDGTVTADGLTVDGDVTIDTNTLVVDSTNNRVGIGTSSPSNLLTLQGSGLTRQVIDARTSASNGETASLQLWSKNSGGTNNYGYIDYDGDGNMEIGSGGSGASAVDMVFDTNGTERMRIDSSGRVGIGTDSPISDLHVSSAAPVITATSTNNSSGLRFNVNGTANETYRFQYGGTTQVQINSGGELFLTSNIRRAYGSGDWSIYPEQNGTALLLYCRKSDGGYRGVILDDAYDGALKPTYDNLQDLGIASRRYDDVYATNGSIVTSDRNEKQDIATLSTAEMAVAARLSNQFKTFRWIDSVTEKGDNARTHTGIIAQDVQQAFTDEGLDAGDYALFISSTWWETQTEVPAVEAVDEVLDEDGNVVTEAVEAQEAYTRTDTYKTAEEAPEGATERTRLGIRYPELLSFMQAYNDQRMANIEARLDALEAN